MNVCPTCGKSVGGMALKCGMVKIVTHHCECGRIWRTSSLLAAFAVHDAIAEVDRLKKKYYPDPPYYARYAVQLLQSKIDDHARSTMEKELALRQRRHDVWERKFLNDAYGDVFA